MMGIALVMTLIFTLIYFIHIPTSEDVQGLVARGGTVQDTLEIAKDVARRLLDAQS